jgi:hypothetical protein
MGSGRIFITGCYRSGTTLLEKLLHSHPRVTVASQPMPALYHVTKQRFLDARGLQRRYPLDHLFLEDAYRPAELDAFLEQHVLDEAALDRVFEQLGQHAEGHWTPEIATMRSAFRPGTLLQQLDTLRACVQRIFPRAEPQAFIGTKEVVCEEYVPFLRRHGVACILVVRDPRDVIASVNFGARYAQMGELRPILYTVRAWRKSVAFALAGDVHTVRYEELVARPASTLHTLTDALHLAPLELSAPLRDQRGEAWAGNSSFSDAHGVTTHAVGRTLPADVLRYVETACLPEMLALGYPPREVTQFDASVLASYRPPFARIHAKFPPDYSFAPERVAAEAQRYEHLRADDLHDDAARARWFVRPEAYVRLRASLRGAA